MKNDLNDFEVEAVRKRAREKLGECRKSNDIIGTQIFSILGLYARVIYYPLKKDAPWGFTRISGSRNDAALEKPFVAINTSIPIDCQVFAAAHELYHIWYEQNPDILPADLLNEEDKRTSEKKANRFAAEFLVDEMLLKQEIELYKIRKITIKSILQLAEVFMVPYRTMAKRLREINVIGSDELKKYLAETEDSIQRYKKRYSIPIQKPDERVTMDNLVELTVNAYEAGYITFEKMEYLLSICNLKPEDLGIEKASKYEFPSDDELDCIMEE